MNKAPRWARGAGKGRGNQCQDFYPNTLPSASQAPFKQIGALAALILASLPEMSRRDARRLVRRMADEEPRLNAWRIALDCL